MKDVSRRRRILLIVIYDLKHMYMMLAAPWLQTCKRANPNENKCFRQLFEGCFPQLAAGIPEIGVKSFEPLNIDQVSVSKGSGNLVLSGGFQNLVIRGPSNATVRRAK